MARKASRWIPLFSQFIKDLKINSKVELSLDGKGTELKMWNSQRRFMEEVGNGLDDGIRIFKCLKSRQLGVTTIALAIDLFWLAMHPGLTGALVTDSEKNRDVNRATLRRFIHSFPPGYFGSSFAIKKGGDNRQFMSFTNGSRLDFLVAGVKKKSISWGEGVGYAMAHLTELASYGDADGLASFEEAFAPTGEARLFIYESTAKGFNHWRDSWKKGVDNLNERSFFIGWWASDLNVIERDDPRFDVYGTLGPSSAERELMQTVGMMYGHLITPEQLAWIRWRSEQADDQNLLEQNQPWFAEQAFTQSGSSFFNMRMVARDIKTIDASLGVPNSPFLYWPYKYEYGNDFFSLRLIGLTTPQEAALETELKVWEEPMPNGRYVIGCDPAYGRNEHKDRHAIGVWRCFADRLVQVAEYATANVEVKHAAWVLAHLAGAYSNCMVNVELSGPGRMLIQEWDHLRSILNTEMYRDRVHQMNWEEALYHARWYLYTRPDTMGKGFALCFETNWRTKQEIMHQLRGSYATNNLDIRSRDLLLEMGMVVQDGHEIGAPESRSEDCKDDRVFAMALANRAWINWVRQEMAVQGLSYDVVMKAETAVETKLVRSVNSVVYNFLRTMDEKAANPPDPRPAWMVQRGLA